MEITIVSLAVGILGTVAILVGVGGAIWRRLASRRSGSTLPISPLLVSAAAGVIVVLLAVQLYLRDY